MSKIIALEKYEVKFVIGSELFELTKTDLSEISQFVDVCERAGVFDQPAFLSQENKIIPFTLFNED